MKKFALPLIALALTALVAYALLTNERPQAQAFALKDLNGQTVSDAQFRDKVTLLNFWYPSCPGCVIEMPKLIATQQKFADTAYQTIAVSLPYNTEAEVREYVRSKQLPFMVAIDTDGAVGAAYKVQLAPNSFLIDKNGRVVKAYLGEPDWDELHRLIEQELPS